MIPGLTFHGHYLTPKTFQKIRRVINQRNSKTLLADKCSNIMFIDLP